MADLAVVIVTWNVRDLAIQALESLFADLDASGLEAAVYVVDSASADGTADLIATRFSQVHLTASSENLGFGRANNLALRQIGFGERSLDTLPPAVYLLNPDTITKPGATRALYDYLMADARRGLVGARLSYGDGSFQHSAFSFPGLRQLWAEFFPIPGRFYESAFNGRYPRELYAAGEPFRVDFPLGATMMLRREVIAATGMFDEAFFMYCEEIDWAWRIHEVGWEAWCVPAAEVVHLAGQSTGQARPRSILNLWESRMRLYDKHLPRWKCWIARGLIALGASRRARREPDPAISTAYQQVARLALGHEPG